MRCSSGKSRGLTVLELLLATCLAFAFTASMFTIRHRRRQVVERSACARENWTLTTISEEMEWKMRGWEAMAPFCLNAGFVPLQRDPATGVSTLWAIHSVRPLREPQTVPALFPIPKDHDFIVGESILICGRGLARSATIKRFNNPASMQPTMEVAYENEQDEAGQFFPQKTLVVQIRPFTYALTEPLEKSGRVLLERDRTGQTVPLASHLEDWSLRTNSNSDKERLDVSMEWKTPRCGIQRRFSLSYRDIDASPGFWRLTQTGEIELTPWNPAEKAPSAL